MGSDSTSANPIKKFKPLALLILWGFDFLYAMLSRVRIVGKEHVPLNEAVLVVINHSSYADPPLIYIGVRRPDMVVLVADTYKPFLPFRWIVEGVGGVWIKRGAGDRGAVKAALDVLSHGNLLGMAPEGTRSKSGKLQEGKAGAAFLASKAGVKILPAGISGAYDAFEQLQHLRRPQITLTFGPTFTLPPLEGENKAALLDHYTHEIMCRIAALIPDECHGVYQDDPRIKEIREMGK